MTKKNKAPKCGARPCPDCGNMLVHYQAPIPNICDDCGGVLVRIEKGVYRCVDCAEAPKCGCICQNKHLTACPCYSDPEAVSQELMREPTDCDHLLPHAPCSCIKCGASIPALIAQAREEEREKISRNILNAHPCFVGNPSKEYLQGFNDSNEIVKFVLRTFKNNQP